MKLKHLIFCFLLICFSQAGLIANAQNLKIDSLKRSLQEHPEENRFNVLWGLAYELFDIDNPQALIYARQSNEVAIRNGDSLEIVKSGRITGQLFRRDDKVDQSIEALSWVLPISKRHKFEDETLMILNALAIGHSYKAEYDKALGYHFQSLIMREKEGDGKQISVSLNNIGFVYYKLEDFPLALEYYLGALKAKQETKYFYDFETLLVNIGLCYNYLDDCENARKYFNEANGICGPLCSGKTTLLIDHGLGRTFMHEMKYIEAERHFKRSLLNSDKLRQQRYQLINLIELTELSITLNNIEDARNYLNRAKSIPDKSQYPGLLLEIYKLNAKLFTRSNDLKSANLFLWKYAELKDEVFDSKVKLGLMKVQAQYAERENLARIESQANILSLQQKGIERQKLLNWLTVAVILLTIVLVMLLYKSNRRKQRINEMLDRRVRERTLELEKNRDELKHSHDENVMVLRKVSSDLTSSFATLSGLSNLAAKDLPEEQAVYFRAAEATAERMVNSVNKYSSPH